MKNRRFRRLILFCAALAVVLVWTTMTSIQLLQDKAERERQLAELEAQHAQLKQEEQMLQEQLRQAQDPEHIAELARKNFFMTKEGERLFILTTKNP